MSTQRATKKQQELFNFVNDFIKDNGYGPSYREIMRALDYKSVSTVAVHIDGLIARGLLRKKNRSARSIEIVGLSQSADKVNSAEQDKLNWLEFKFKQLIESPAISQSEKSAIKITAQLIDPKINLMESKDGNSKTKD